VPAVVTASDLTKHYRVQSKAPGALATLKHFLKRETKLVEAVKGVSFEVGEGEVVGFLGPNGAGKTTTLKMLTGLIHPTAGRCEVSGHVPFDRAKAFLKQITLVMGNKQQLIWDLPAADSLRINAAVYEIDDDEASRRTAELAEMLDVTDKLKQPVRKLSLGERMKLELLAALLHRPKVLFLDEPTLGLDVNAQSAVREFLRGYNERYGATVLLTSHYMADIVALCERVVLIHEGGLVYDGALDALLERIAPHREVTVKLAQRAPDDVRDKLPDIVSVDDHVLKLHVPRDALTQRVADVLEGFDVVDLSVGDPPVEDVIAQAFSGGLGPAEGES
jgi:ABC-2 type transport system ATP-binding protein